MSGGDGDRGSPRPDAEPGRPRQWFEDEGFWEAYAPIMFDGDRWGEVPAVIDAIEALAAPPKGGAVLDACCGPGRHSLELASRGYRVTGVDITEAYLEAARESAAAFGFDVEFLRADLRSFARPAAFDLAVNLYTSFGYFEDPAEDLAFLRGIRRSLKPGGAFVIELRGKETLARDFIEDEWYERGGLTVLVENSIEGAWEGLRNRWVILRGKGKEVEMIDTSFVIRLYSARELQEALLEAGFSSAEAFGSLRGAPYDHKAESLVVLARA